MDGENGTFVVRMEDGKIVEKRKFNGVEDRREALRQAVIFANAQAHAVRKTPEEVVVAAKAFEAFLGAPEPEATA